MPAASNRTRNLIVGGVVVVLVIAVAAAVVVATSSSGSGGMASPLPAAGYFETLPPGAALPTDAQCAARVHRSRWEPRNDNTTANNTKPKQPVVLADDPAYNAAFQANYKPRVTGDFTGTTDEIIQWGACKWGLSDNMVRAQAVDETHWHQNTESDPEPRSNGNCPPGETRDPCPTSFGILQIKWYFHPRKSAVGSSYPMSKTMTAFSLDYTLSEERGCYDGLSFVGDKAKGDLYGCMGIWYSGEFRNQLAEEYIARVKKNLSDKAWLKWRGQTP
jgi:autotransporter family porin